MSTKNVTSPLLSRAFISNGDSSSEDDDVFLNSRLDVMSRNCDLMDQQSDYDPSKSNCFLNFKMEQRGSIHSIFTPSPKSIESAVIFSVHFCGKYFGEVGLFEPDISILDWVGFKSYLFSSLNLESFGSYAISYSDEDGDKVPIESEDDYLEALKIAKAKAVDEEKLSLHISRLGGGFHSSLRSLVSSSLRRVNSVGTSRVVISSSQPPQKKDVTTSTSFHSLDKANSKTSTELNGANISSSCMPLPEPTELNSPQENYFAGSHAKNDDNEYIDKTLFDFVDSYINNGSKSYLHGNNDWETVMANSQEEKVETPEVPVWFNAYMKQFKEEFSLEVSAKIDEKFNEAVGNISAADVETKLKGLLTGYSTELQNKVLCCCRAQIGGHCQKTILSQPSVETTLGGREGSDVPVRGSLGGFDTPVKMDREQLSTPLSALRMEYRDESIEGEAPNQDYFLQKLLRREQEILDFLDCTNEKIKQKIKVNNDYTNSLRSCLTKELAIEERERVLARIENFRQRQNRTTNDIKMLQQSVHKAMEGNNESILRLTLPETPQPRDYDAKFIKDESFVDGSKVLPDQCFSKHWAVQNIGLKPWTIETYLVCQSYHQMKPFKEKIACPPLQPGQIGRITAEFRAPLTPGIYSTEWRFAHCSKLFGNHLWCTVIVPSESSAASVDRSPAFESEDTDVGLGFEGLGRYTDYTDFIGTQSNLLLRNEPNDKLKYEEGSQEHFAITTKDAVRKMNAYQLLKYILYIIRISQPDFGSLRETREFKALSNCLTRGNTRDYFNLRLLLDASFLKNCARDNFTLDEMIGSYEQIFLTEDETGNDMYVKDLSFRYLHKTFDSPEINLGFDPGSESFDNDTESSTGEEPPQASEGNLPRTSGDSFPGISRKCSGKDSPLVGAQSRYDPVDGDVKIRNTTYEEGTLSCHRDDGYEAENDFQEEEYVCDKVCKALVKVLDLKSDSHCESKKSSSELGTFHVEGKEGIQKEQINEHEQEEPGAAAEEERRHDESNAVRVDSVVSKLIPKKEEKYQDEDVCVISDDEGQDEVNYEGFENEQNGDEIVRNRNENELKKDVCDYEANESDCEDELSSSYSEYSNSELSVESGVEEKPVESDFDKELEIDRDCEHGTDLDKEHETDINGLETDIDIEREIGCNDDFQADFNNERKVDHENDHNDKEIDRDKEHVTDHNDKETDHDYEHEICLDFEHENDLDNEHKNDLDDEHKNDFDNEYENDFGKEHERDFDNEHAKDDLYNEHETDIDYEHETDLDNEHETDFDNEHETDIDNEHETDLDNEYETDLDNEHETDLDNEHETDLDNEHETDYDYESDQSPGEDPDSDHNLGHETFHDIDDDNEQETDHENEREADNDGRENGHDMDINCGNYRECIHESDYIDESGAEERLEEALEVIGFVDGSHHSNSRGRERIIEHKPSTNDLKKDINSLHENFNQNVQVHLDFEVISRIPPLELQSREETPSGQSDPLTFQERHFTLSSLPPPAPIQVPESDDDSFDGLVFIKDEEIPSSTPATEPGSPCPRHLNGVMRNDSQLSMTGSSLSEYDENDASSEQHQEAEGNPHNVGSPTIEECDRTDLCTESSSSEAVDKETAVYYESILFDDNLETFFEGKFDDKTEDLNRFKSPEFNVDSRSSTSHTLKDVGISESSESCDIMEPAMTMDVTQEKAT